MSEAAYAIRRLAFAHKAACGLSDVMAHRTGISATEFLVRREARPTRFANVVLREEPTQSNCAGS
jgi:hypothetical protein